MARRTSRPPSPSALPRMLTPDEVARLLRTSRAGVYAAAARGSIPRPTRIGRRVLFSEDALLRFLATGNPEEPPMPPTIVPAPPDDATAVAPVTHSEAQPRIDPLLRARARRALRRGGFTPRRDA